MLNPIYGLIRVIPRMWIAGFIATLSDDERQVLDRMIEFHEDMIEVQRRLSSISTARRVKEAIDMAPTRTAAEEEAIYKDDENVFDSIDGDDNDVIQMPPKKGQPYEWGAVDDETGQFKPAANQPDQSAMSRSNGDEGTVDDERHL